MPEPRQAHGCTSGPSSSSPQHRRHILSSTIMPKALCECDCFAQAVLVWNCSERPPKELGLRSRKRMPIGEGALRVRLHALLCAAVLEWNCTERPPKNLGGSALVGEGGDNLTHSPRAASSGQSHHNWRSTLGTAPHRHNRCRRRRCGGGQGHPISYLSLRCWRHRPAARAPA